LAAQGLAGAALAKKGRSYERNKYFSRSAYRSVHHSAAPLEAHAETAVGQGSSTNDLPVLRVDHVPIKGALLGVWQPAFPRVLVFKGMNRRFVHVSTERT
jgi:hypothetical protein